MEREIANVSLSPDVWIDYRFRDLARDLGITPFDAIARCAVVWGRATFLETDTLPAEEIDRVTERPGFAASMARCELTEGTVGAVRIRGGKDRLFWLKARREDGRTGGRKRAENANARKGSQATLSHPCKSQVTPSVSKQINLIAIPILFPRESKEEAGGGQGEDAAPPLSPPPVGDSLEKPTGVLKKKPRTPVPIPAELALSPEFLAAWTDWGAHRRELRKPLTPTAERQQLAKLAGLGPVAAVAALRHSTGQGYIGVFEADPVGRKRVPRPAVDGPSTPATKGEPIRFWEVRWEKNDQGQRDAWRDRFRDAQRVPCTCGSDELVSVLYASTVFARVAVCSKHPPLIERSERYPE